MNPLDALKKADAELKRQVEEKQRLKNERDRQFILESVANSLPGMMSPLLERVSENSRIASDEILSALQNVKIEQPKVDVNVTTPEAKVTVTNEPITIPPIDTSGIEEAITKGMAKMKMPKPEVTVNTPEIKFPDFPIPEPFDGNVTLKDVSKKSPLPVMMMGADGKPFQMAQSAGGGRGDFYTIKDIQNSTGGSLIDNDGFLKVTGAFSVSSSGGSTVSLVNSDGTYYNSDNPLPVTGSFTSTPGLQVSGAVDSVNVVDAFGSTAVTGVWNADNRLRVSLETGGSGLTDSELRASHLDVQQLSGAIDSVYLTGVFGTVGVVTIDPDGNPKYSSASSGLTDTELRASSVPVIQVSGNIDSVYVTGVATSIYSEFMNPDGRVKVELPTGSSGLTDTELRASHLDVQQLSGAIDSVNVLSMPAVVVTSITNSIGANLLDSSGVGYSGSNPLPISDAGGSLTVDGSVAVSGITGTVGANIVDSGGVAYTTSNPLPISDAGGIITVDGTVAVSDITASLKSALIDSSGVQYSGSNPVPISGAVTQSGTWNVGTVTTVTGITNSLQASLIDSSGVQYSGSNPVPTKLNALESIGTDVLTTRQVSGASDSVVVQSGTITAVTSITNSVAATILDESGSPWQPFTYGQGDLATALRIIQAGESVSSVVVNSGTVTAVTSITNSVAASIVDSSGVMYGSANPLHIAVHDSTGSTISSFPSGDIKGLAVAIVDGSGAQITSFGGGTQYAEGATASTYTGTAVMFAEASSDAAKVVSSVDPLPVTLATALSKSTDSVLSRPIQVRGSLSTAYTSVSTGTEATLLAGTTGVYHDLIKIMLSNASTAAVGVDIRAVTGGNITHHFEVPANGVVGESLATPWPQDATGNNWTVDLPDITGTTVYVSALFSNE